MRKSPPPFLLLLAILATGALSCDSSLLGQAAAIPVQSTGQSSPGQGGPALHRTTAEIMSTISSLPPRQHIYLKREMELPGRRNRPQDPNAAVSSQFPRR